MRTATQSLALLLAILIVCSPSFSISALAQSSQPKSTTSPSPPSPAAASSPPAASSTYEYPFGGYNMFADNKNEPWKIDICAAKECLLMGLNDKAEQLLASARDCARESRGGATAIAYSTYFHAVALQRLNRERDAIAELSDAVALMKQVSKGSKPLAELPICEYLLAYLLEGIGNHGEAQQQLGKSIADVGAYLRVKGANPTYFGDAYIGQSRPFMDPEFYFSPDTLIARRLLDGETKETLPALESGLLKVAALCEIRSQYGLATLMYSAYSKTDTRSFTYEQQFWRDKMLESERSCYDAWAMHAFWLAQARIQDRIDYCKASPEIGEFLASANEITNQVALGNMDEAIKLTTARGVKIQRRPKSAETNSLLADNEIMLAVLLCKKRRNLDSARSHFDRAESLLTEKNCFGQSQLMEVLVQKGLAMQLFAPKSDWLRFYMRALSVLDLVKPSGMMYTRVADLDTALRMRIEDVLYQQGGPWGFGILSPDTTMTKAIFDVSSNKNENDESAKRRKVVIKYCGGAGALRESMFNKLLYFCYCTYAQNADASGRRLALDAYELLADGVKDMPSAKYVAGMMSLFDIFVRNDDYIHARRCLKDVIESGVASASEIALCYARLSDISFEENDSLLAERFAERAMTIVTSEHIQGAPLVAALTASGAAAMKRGKLDSAFEKIQSAMRATGAQTKKVSEPYLRLLVLLTDVQKRQDEYAKARKNGLQAMKLAASEARFKLERARILQLLGEIEVAEKHSDEAIRYFRASIKELDVSPKTTNREEFEITVDSYRSLANFSFAMNDRKEAALYALDAAIIFNYSLPKVVSQMSFAAQCEYLARAREQLDTLIRNCTFDSSNTASAYSYAMKWKGLLVELLRRQSVLIFMTQALKPEETKRLNELRILLAEWEVSNKRTTEPELWLTHIDNWTQEKEGLEQELWDTALQAQREASSRKFLQMYDEKGKPKQPKTSKPSTPEKKKSEYNPYYRVYGERHVDALYAEVVRDLYAELLVGNRKIVQDFILSAELRLAEVRREWAELKDTSSFQESMLANEGMIDFIQYIDEKGESSYGCFVISKERDPVFLRLGTAKTIDSAIAEWRQDILWQSVTQKQTTDLSDLILANALNKFPSQVQRVWVSPDGELARLPFEVLIQAQSATAVSTLVSQVDSVRELVLLRRDPLIAKESAKDPAKAAKSPACNVVLVGDVDFGDPRIPNLPQTKIEIESIKTLANTAGDNVNVNIVTGANATKSSVVKCMTDTDWLHLATHGYFSGAAKEIGPDSLASRAAPYRIPTRAATPAEIRNSTQRNALILSGIILAKGNGADSSSKEGRLTAEELIGVNLARCKLFTLSACDTGRGKEVSGQGIIGLRSAIMAAGAKCVLMSLWKVDDRATRLLMEEFYSNMWKQKLSPAESLRRAQETVRSTKGFNDPYFWAAWILVGDAW